MTCCLLLSQAIKEVHLTYLNEADIIETNTFSGTTVAMADYEMEDLVYELNFESAKLTRENGIFKKTPKNLVLLLDLLDQPTNTSMSPMLMIRF